MNKNINSINSKDFTNHKQIVRTISIPSKEGTNCFNRFTYDEELLKDIITKVEYDKIIETASKIMGNALLKKKNNDKFKVSNLTIINSYISFGLIICYALILYLAQDSHNSETMIYLAFIIVTIALFLITLSAFCNFFRKTRKFQTLSELIKEDLCKYFEQINNTFSFSKVNNRYKFTGTLNFTYHSNKKVIECQIERVENKNDEEERTERVINFPLSDVLTESSGEKVMTNSVFKDDENDSINPGSSNISKKPTHFRVKSVVSHKGLVFNPKEIELELNKSIN